jgi:hypothetical protein
MLRQQQAEIEELKAAKIRAYNNGVEDGRKPDTNNEPVAWTDVKGNYFDKNSFFPVDDLIPLYTHLVKELTDEEIEECFAESCTDFKLLKNGKTQGVVNIIDVGRAILRKAQK